jgi:dTDP-4-dehydrorhamnose reductase
MASALILGIKGQLGQELLRARWPTGLSPVGYDLDELDITQRSAVEQSVAATKPLLVINAAAYTAVDKAETERERAFAVNAEGPDNIALACSQAQVPLLHVSTDYVFSGEKDGPYVESDPVAPLGVYGLSKAQGEQAVRSRLNPHVIVRTSWVFGAFGHNFVKTMLRLAKERPELRVVNDQRGRPTAAQDLAAALIHLSGRYLEQKTLPWGTYHFANHGTLTWYDFASNVVEMQERWTSVRPKVTPIATADFPTPARRPRNSELCTAAFEANFGLVPRPFRLPLTEVLEELFKA